MPNTSYINQTFDAIPPGDINYSETVEVIYMVKMTWMRRTPGGCNKMLITINMTST